MLIKMGIEPPTIQGLQKTFIGLSKQS